MKAQRWQYWQCHGRSLSFFSEKEKEKEERENTPAVSTVSPVPPYGQTADMFLGEL
jgi:hypothetical protein